MSLTEVINTFISKTTTTPFISQTAGTPEGQSPSKLATILRATKAKKNPKKQTRSCSRR